MGLLRTPEDEEAEEDDNEENEKDKSPFKDLMATLEKPADLSAYPGTPVSLFQHHNVTSPPRSADYCSKKTTFFQVRFQSCSVRISSFLQILALIFRT